MRLAGISAVSMVVAAALLASGPETGWISLKLPYPSSKAAVTIPPERLPKIAPLEGVFTPNNILKKAERLFDGKIQSSETVAVAPDGGLRLLDKFGALWRASKTKDGSFKLYAQPLARLGPGRPLGFHLDRDGNLIVCNAGTGLQMVEKDTNKVVLLAGLAPVRSGNLTRIQYANDLDIAADGSIYFTDSQEFGPILNAAGFYDTLRACILGILQGSPTGRLLRYDPQKRKTTLVADDFLYANGVALSADGKFVLVVETGTWTVHRIWLSGPKAGAREVWVDRLPGFPDGISRSADGKSFWIAVVMPKNILSKVLPSRWLRFVAAWLPDKLRPPPKQWGCIVQVDTGGKVLRVLMDADGSHVAVTSAVYDTDKFLYLGNLNGGYVSRLDKALLPPILT